MGAPGRCSTCGVILQARLISLHPQPGPLDTTSSTPIVDQFSLFCESTNILPFNLTPPPPPPIKKNKYQKFSVTSVKSDLTQIGKTLVRFSRKIYTKFSGTSCSFSVAELKAIHHSPPIFPICPNYICLVLVPWIG